VNKAWGAQIHWGHSLEESVLKIWGVLNFGNILTARDIQIPRNPDLGVYRLDPEAKVIENSSHVLLHHQRFIYTSSIRFRARQSLLGADEEISDGGIPRVIVLGYDGLPMQPVAPPSPDYIPGPEDPRPYHLSFPAEEQHLTPPVDSPTGVHPGMFTESDPEEDPKEISGDDADDEDEDDEDEEGDDYLALADSAIGVPTVEPVSPPEGTEPAIPPPSTDITTIGARITVRLQAFISLLPKAEVERLLVMPTPPPSPPISLSLPSVGERLVRCMAPSAHSSLPPVPSPLLPSSGCPTQIQTLKIASTQALVDAVTAALPSPPLPPLPPSLYIPPPIDRKDDIPESERPPSKRSCLFALGSRYEVGESSTARPTRGRGVDYGFVSTVDAEARRQGISEVGYGIRDTWVDSAEAVPEVAPMTLGEVNTRVIELAELHEHDTQDLYALLEDAQDSRTRISQRVTMDSQRVDLLMGDRIAHQETILIVEEDAYASREAYYELQTHREQAELLSLLGQRRRARQPGSDARAPNHQEASRDADSHI
ncbi:hypothetical protein Tco_0548683, partial [Tanacetum coccineum]